MREMHFWGSERREAPAGDERVGGGGCGPSTRAAIETLLLLNGLAYKMYHGRLLFYRSIETEVLN